ncbi:MAG: glycerophosphodiester phosphodiesterase, partial [Deltaproteobacteria bacterium]
RGQRIPLLEEVVRLVPEGRGLLVEVKSGTETVKPLHELLQRTGVGRRIVVMSFDLDVATAIKNLEPSRVVLWLVKAEKGLVGLRKPISEKVIGIAKGRGLDGLGLDVRGTSLELARKVKRAGLVLYVWTVDDPARAKRMIDAGADGIITNRPGWLRKKLKL